MKSTEFIGKFKSRYLWGNLLAMAVTVALLMFGVKVGIDVYTHHGESIGVPDVRHKSFADAEHILSSLGLQVVVSDTGYVKTLPPDCILEQSPGPGEHVKSGHIIYVTVNASHTPTIALPDVVDNSSLREAMAKLTAMGFKLGQPEYIPGEKDWVYGILVKGRHVVAGDKVSIDDVLIIQVGNGRRDAGDSVEMVDPMGGSHELLEGSGETEDEAVDNFEVVPGTESGEPSASSHSHSHNQNEVVE